MYLVEIFLPLARGDGAPVPFKEIEGLVADMADRFGGATAFTREPAKGLWKEAGDVQRDDIVIVEVMVEELDDAWWHERRDRLQRQFAQEQILIRATRCQVI